MNLLLRMRTAVSLSRWSAELPGLRPSSPSAFACAALLVGAAAAGHVLLAPWIVNACFVTFYLAVIVTTFVGGIAAGLAAILLSIGAAWSVVLPPMTVLQQACTLS